MGQLADGYVSSSLSQRNARSPGMKQYSPPRVTTNLGSAVIQHDPLRESWPVSRASPNPSMDSQVQPDPGNVASHARTRD